jgi:hypothetical protein
MTKTSRYPFPPPVTWFGPVLASVARSRPIASRFRLADRLNLGLFVCGPWISQVPWKAGFPTRDGCVQGKKNNSSARRSWWKTAIRPRGLWTAQVTGKANFLRVRNMWLGQKISGWARHPWWKIAVRPRGPWTAQVLGKAGFPMLVPMCLGQKQQFGMDVCPGQKPSPFPSCGFTG